MTEPVSQDMMARIRDEIAAIEARETIRIVLAVESGSRAWGFHSPDSDYDVRFIYTRPEEWHYRLGKRRDVVEYPIDSELDLSGWELRKALELTLGSNAVVGEWLQSPIVYRSEPDSVAALRDFAARCLNRRSVTWHYLSLARRQQARLTAPGGGVRLKRFFYVLRPVLSLRWMRLNDRPMPPMDMTALRQACDLSPEQEAALDTLTARKMAALERAETTTRDPVLAALVEAEMTHAEDWLHAAPKPPVTSLKAEADRLHLALSKW